jgi:hypothetical protein
VAVETLDRSELKNAQVRTIATPCYAGTVGELHKHGPDPGRAASVHVGVLIQERAVCFHDVRWARLQHDNVRMKVSR